MLTKRHFEKGDTAVSALIVKVEQHIVDKLKRAAEVQNKTIAEVAGQLVVDAVDVRREIPAEKLDKTP